MTDKPARITEQDVRDNGVEVYLFRRKGLEPFLTCSRERFDELSRNDSFETKVLYENALVSAPFPHPRISEDELKIIAKKYYDWCNSEVIFNRRTMLETWVNDEGRTLLNKLNQDREQVTAVAVPDGWKVGSLITVNQDQYPGLGAFFAQIWDMNKDEVVARVYGDDREEIQERINNMLAAPSHSQQSARTPQDYAIEHAEYMAVNGEQLIEYLNEISDAEEGVLVPDDRFGDYVQGLRCGIHDFRKRRDRCPSHESNQSGGKHDL